MSIPFLPPQFAPSQTSAKIDHLPAGGYVVTIASDTANTFPMPIFAASGIDEVFAYIRQHLEPQTVTQHRDPRYQYAAAEYKVE